jgi:hypothetical protein
VERLLQRIEDPHAPLRRKTVLPVRLIPRGSGELPPRPAYPGRTLTRKTQTSR